MRRRHQNRRVDYFCLLPPAVAICWDVDFGPCCQELFRFFRFTALSIRFEKLSLLNWKGFISHIECLMLINFMVYGYCRGLRVCFSRRSKFIFLLRSLLYHLHLRVGRKGCRGPLSRQEMSFWKGGCTVRIGAPVDFRVRGIELAELVGFDQRCRLTRELQPRHFPAIDLAAVPAQQDDSRLHPGHQSDPQQFARPPTHVDPDLHDQAH